VIEQSFVSACFLANSGVPQGSVSIIATHCWQASLEPLQRDQDADVSVNLCAANLSLYVTLQVSYAVQATWHSLMAGIRDNADIDNLSYNYKFVFVIRLMIIRRITNTN